MRQQDSLNSAIESASQKSAHLLFEVQSLIDSYPQGRHSFPSELDFNMYILPQAKCATDSGEPCELLVDGAQKSLVKMRLLEFIDSDSPSFKGYLILSFKDKTKLPIPLNSANCLDLKELFKVQGCNLDRIYSRKSALAVDWIKSNVDTVYNSYASRRDKVDEFYDSEHLKINNEIRRILAKEPALKSINIIDGGCGNGKYINATANAFNEIDVHLVGFDFNESNIEQAQSKYSDKGTFIRGDLLNFQEVLDQCAHVLDDNAPTFIVLSGSLTRLVLTNGFQALKVLQGFAQTDFADYLVGCGVGEPLINRRIAKQVGYRMEPSTTTASELFSCKKMTQKEFINQKLKKLKQYNTLDLSLYHNPSALLDNQQLLKHLADDSIIDLSFTTLTPKLIDAIKLIIKEKPKVKLVFWHNQINQLQEFYDSFPEEHIKSMYYTRDEHFLGASWWFNSSFEPDLTDLSDQFVSSQFSDFYIKNLLLHSKNERSVFLNLIHLSEQYGLRNWIFDNTLFLEYLKNEQFHNTSAQKRDELVNSAVQDINSSNFEKVMYLLEKLNLINSTTDPELYYLLHVYNQPGIYGSDLLCKTLSSTQNRKDRIIESLKFYNRDFEDAYQNLIMLVKNISLDTPKEVHNRSEELVFWAIKNWSNFEDVEHLVKTLDESKLIDPQKDLVIYYMLAFFKQYPDRRADVSNEANLGNEKGRLIEALKFYDERHHDSYLQMVTILVANQWQKEFDFLAIKGQHQGLIRSLSHSYYPEFKLMELLPYLNADGHIVFSYNGSTNSLEIQGQFDFWYVNARAEVDVKLQRLGFTDTEIANIINPFQFLHGTSDSLIIPLKEEQVQSLLADLDTIKTRPEKNILESAFYQTLIALPSDEFDDEEQSSLVTRVPTFFSSSLKSRLSDDNSMDDYARLGLTREQAHSLLIENLHNIQEHLTPLINEKLLDKQFLEYLNTKQLRPQNSPLDHVTSQANQFASDPEIIHEYINYEIHDRTSQNDVIEPMLFELLQNLINKTPKLG
ncbi:class I SAM-dependent methyltransferase [Legionella bononiensis]|uniref:Class I SAM-dependent methyltransferase n=1 Tax=Legionella bononiensis TaxID=2793102 RepID=A0ABS1WE22_9GAMM|nr:class I SAM-dependent methyltransferase [Legionella bononiensis]MBL7479520.1 class I SAM-dependent methyltransferase [Legionella bononiensis]MBL7527606.1 class I SAM-dependent methyltransferase [Legionella bononiensis]